MKNIFSAPGLFFLCMALNAQPNVGIGGSPNASAKLDIQSTTQGILITRMTAGQRDSIANPVDGLQVYNTTCHAFNYYNGSAWVDMFGNPVTAAPSTPTLVSNFASQTQVIWYWDTVSTAIGYKVNTVNNYYTAINNGTNTSYTQTGVACGSTDTLYVWAYNGCGNSSAALFIQTMPTCFTCGSVLTDSRDSQTYNTTLIGTQCWMAQSLNYGTQINLTVSGSQLPGQKYCYNGDTANCTVYGGLYEWAAMMNGSSSCNGTGSSQPACVRPVQGICPVGWHIPSHYEITLMEQNAGSSPGSFPYDVMLTGWLGSDEGSNLKQTGYTLWGGANGAATNSTGFTGLPSQSTQAGIYLSDGTVGYWWSSTESDASNAWDRALRGDYSQVYRSPNPKSSGINVRCVEN